MGLQGNVAARRAATELFVTKQLSRSGALLLILLA